LRCSRLKNAIATVVVIVTAACAGSNVPEDAGIIGQWEKQDRALPPISLTLSSDGGSTVARLRFSGSDLIGTALVEGARLKLRFPGRPDMVGEFVSNTELTLRLDDGGPGYLLTKRATLR
jgi:hypothetical protein